MPSTSRIMMGIGLTLLVAGVASGGFGVYLQSTDNCESGYEIDVHKLTENQTTTSTAEHVTYSKLSATEQQVFREILRSNETRIYQNETALRGLSRRVVTYRGEQYETSAVFASDCGNSSGIALR
ncbi:MAG: hypothetical protein ABEJ26_07510 [Halosimplex sp.]